MPFLTEEIYQNIVRGADPDAPESVHLTAYPRGGRGARRRALEQEMDAVIRWWSMGRAARNATQLKVRQPLARMLVAAPDKVSREGVEKGSDQIIEELNIKALEIIDDPAGLVTYSLKANFKTLGPKLGKKMGVVAKAVEALDVNDTVPKIKAGEALSLEAGGETLALDPGDVEIRSEQQEGLFAQEDHGWVVALDTRLDEKLILEGIARDFIRDVANFRKEADFKVDDRIHIYVETSGKVLEAVKAHHDFISAENLAVRIEHTFQDSGHAFETKIAGEKVRLALEKL